MKITKNINTHWEKSWENVGYFIFLRLGHHPHREIYCFPEMFHFFSQNG